MCLLLYSAQALLSWKNESAFPPPLGSRVARLQLMTVLRDSRTAGPLMVVTCKYLRNGHDDVCLLVHTMDRFLTP